MPGQSARTIVVNWTAIRSFQKNEAPPPSLRAKLGPHELTGQLSVETLAGGGGVEACAARPPA